MNRTADQDATHVAFHHGPTDHVSVELDWSEMKAGQQRWLHTGWSRRLTVLKRFRQEAARGAEQLAESASEFPGRPVNEIVLAQISPLLEACRFLERFAPRILSGRSFGSLKFFLGLTGVSGAVEREPYGIVLIIAPSNYSIYLPAVTALQALAAGNAVILKPGRGNGAAAQAFAQVMTEAGLPPALLTVLPGTDAAGSEALKLPIDKVVFTGGTTTGKAVSRDLAVRLIPAQYELSGCDVCYIRHDADLELAARGICFGIRLNGGATCIAPRRIFLHRAIADSFRPMLSGALSDASVAIAGAETDEEGFRVALQEALAGGAVWLKGGWSSDQRLILPSVLDRVTAGAAILRHTWFCPLLTITEVADDQEAVRYVNASRYRLGASIFSEDRQAVEDLARTFSVGVVTINDVIVPTAHPQAPFGGRGDSGCEVTRGAEGLLALTRPKTILYRSGGHHFHLSPREAPDRQLLGDLLLLRHGRGLKARARAVIRLIRALAGLARPRKANGASDVDLALGPK